MIIDTEYGKVKIVIKKERALKDTSTGKIRVVFRAEVKLVN